LLKRKQPRRAKHRHRPVTGQQDLRPSAPDPRGTRAATERVTDRLKRKNAPRGFGSVAPDPQRTSSSLLPGVEVFGTHTRRLMLASRARSEYSSRPSWLAGSGIMADVCDQLARSGVGQTQTFRPNSRMSVSLPGADIRRPLRHVRFVPISEVGPRKRPLSSRQRPNCGHRRRSGSYAPQADHPEPLASSVRTG
jgi:hypothetical protein